MASFAVIKQLPGETSRICAPLVPVAAQMVASLVVKVTGLVLPPVAQGTPLHAFVRSNVLMAVE